MAKHERMFPIRDTAGKLTNSFVFIRNSGDDETVQRGCEWVLGARFNDARFFYEQDQKLTLDDFLEKTKDILFQAQLGTVRQRADRLAKLARHLAEVTGATPDEKVWAEQAGLIAKADLATGLVSELSSLQGVIGAEYAAREGKPSAVYHALSFQYKTPHRHLLTADEKVAGYLILADHLDKLTGYLGLGLEPSGSSDPFGLRKSVTTLIRTAEFWDGNLPAYSQLMNAAFDLYQEQGFELDRAKAMTALGSIFRGRYEALFTNYKHDVLSAAIPEDLDGLTTPCWVVERFGKVDSLRSNALFVQTATRPINIVTAAAKKGVNFGGLQEFDLEKADTADAKILCDAITTTGHANEEAFLLSLVEPINAFFDNNMIMADDETVRYHRLSLANAVAQHILETGDFTKLEG
jgi:glycyl-tRNA synthetase beta chain